VEDIRKIFEKNMRIALRLEHFTDHNLLCKGNFSPRIPEVHLLHENGNISRLLSLPIRDLLL